ncbi:deoxyribose-phosphate aldolase [Dyadobacter jejuensis]|uniref:Deoxyribose-phosphate aldolase n=1 Tax=Dyadobacter jejuensis TaxID=1082580 RepID=A0A316BBC9_9BACT|nr:deoxyribose-phosphate aldolase [Dyadobacter jejuensis]PWJ59857.1 deoxyribose-phosphate aldolase [Dyadobacter jejuensis]
MQPLASYIDHTLLTPIASETQIRKLCEEAWVFQAKGICVVPSYVGYVASMMEYCPIPIEIVSMVGLPHGEHLPEVNRLEAQLALEQGASELDVVMNLARFKSMAYLSIAEELASIQALARQHQALLKVVIETRFLDSFELHTACEICTDVQADFVHIASDYGSSDAIVPIVRQLRGLLPSSMALKVSGPFTTRQQLSDTLLAGAHRIGTHLTETMLEQV